VFSDEAGGEDAEIAWCLLLGWRAKSRSGFCLPTVAVSANIKCTQPQLLASLPDALRRLDFRQAEAVWPSLATGESFAFALWARRHDAVSLFAAARRGDRSRGLGETVRRCAAQDPGGVPVPSMAQSISPRSARTFSAVASNKMAEKSAFALLAMADRGRWKTTDPAGTTSAARTLGRPRALPR